MEEGNAAGRTPQACDGCRRSKTKCSGTRPQCRRCLKRKMPCSWPSTNAPGTPESLNCPEVSSVYGLRKNMQTIPASAGIGNITHDLPGAALLQRLLDIFFARHHDVELCSFLHKPTTNMVTMSVQAPFLVTSIASLSTLYISENEARSEFGFESTAALSGHYAQLAINFARNLSDIPSVYTIQAYLVLAIRELITWSAFRAWMYAGTAIRMAQALRLGSEFNQRHSPRQKEIRRRTFWACFVVDRLISYSYTHPFTIDMLSVRIKLPCPENTFAFEEVDTGPCLDEVILHTNQLSQLGIAPFYISMLRLWGDMALLHVSGGRRRTVHTPTDPTGEFYRYEKAIENFSSNLPPTLYWSSRNYRLHQVTGQAQAFINFNFLLHHSRCVMNQEYLPQLDSQYVLSQANDQATGWDAAGLPLEYQNGGIIDTCLAAINAITDMATTLYSGSDRDQELLQSTIVANAIMTAAAVHLWVVYTQTCSKCPKPVARAKFVQLLQIIKSWEPRWRVASAWTETLETLYKLYEYSYGTELISDFASWETETGEISDTAELIEERVDENGGHPGLSYGDGIADPATICQRLHDKVRNILVNPLNATDVKKQNLRVFCRTLWQHMWHPGMFDGTGNDTMILDGVMEWNDVDFGFGSAMEYSQVHSGDSSTPQALP